MRTGVAIEASDALRKRLEAVATDSNSKAEHATCAWINLLTNDGLETMAIMAGADASKSTDPALAEAAVHAGSRGGFAARQDAQVGDAADVRGEDSQAGGTGAKPFAGRGDALHDARLGESRRHRAGDGTLDFAKKTYDAVGRFTLLENRVRSQITSRLLQLNRRDVCHPLTNPLDNFVVDLL